MLPLQLMAAVMLTLCLLMIVLIRRWLIRRAPLRTALRELAVMMSAHAQNNDDGQLILCMSQLLRRFSHKRWPQADVAPLSGTDWLAFLESRGGNGDFINGAGSVLAWRGYSATGKIDPPALQALIRQWLKANTA